MHRPVSMDQQALLGLRVALLACLGKPPPRLPINVRTRPAQAASRLDIQAGSNPTGGGAALARLCVRSGASGFGIALGQGRTA